MFSAGPSYPKLKTNLRLSINRLKLLEKKKTELTQKARKEIADYISAGKTERAKIRVEHIIREDYLVEAMEVTEMYCDLVLARFGLIQQMKDLDPGLSEAISSLIWAGPRLMSDVPELKTVGDQFALKYGKPYAQACREQSVSTISEKLIHKMSVQAPPKMLVERYLQEIASNYNLEYTPDPQMLREELNAMDPLISLDGAGGSNNLNDGSPGGASGGSGGGGGMNIPQQPFLYPSKAAEADGTMDFPEIPGQPTYSQPTPFNYQNIQPPPADMSADKPNNMCGGVGSASNWDEMLNLDTSPPPPYTSLDPNCPTKEDSNATPSAPPPSIPPVAAPRSINFPPDVNTAGESSKPDPVPKFDANDLGGGSLGFNLPDLPSVPSTGSSSNKPNNTSPDDIDFDDLNARFQQLKKK